MAKPKFKVPLVSVKIQKDLKREIDYPIFCFRHLHKDYNLEKCSDDHSVALIKQLIRISCLSWQTIMTTPKNGLGSEKISRNSINASIPSSITDDVNDFLSFRYIGKCAIVGFRNNTIFHLVYIDRDFSVYSH